MTSFDALRDTWQAADDPAPPVDPARVGSLRTEAERFDRAIRWRDRREYAAVVFVLAFVGCQFPVIPSDLARAGLALMGLGALFVAGWLWRAQRRRPAPPPDLPAAEALRTALARVEVQVDLLRSVAWWYLLPLVPGPLLFIYGTYGAAAREGLPSIDTLAKGAFVAFLLVAPLLILGAAYGFVYWLNQREVRTGLLPLRDRLARLLHDLDADA